MNFLANQGGGYHANYQRLGGITGWNRDDGWREHEGDWCESNVTWNERDSEKKRNVPPHKRQKPKESENICTKDMLSRIHNKVQGS